MARPRQPRADEARVIFDVPGGQLRLGPRDLELWAEHLVWCYRLMGVGDGATIAVQDFGSSPLSFLGSALLMPGLSRGVAERLGGRFVCLDAATERITLTPAVLAQLGAAVVVVRAEVADLLHEVSRKTAARLGGADLRMIVSFNDDESVPLRTLPWRYMLHVESSMLIAPECPACGFFHLRGGFYSLRANAVRNLRLACAQPHELQATMVMPPGQCQAGPDDWCIRYPVRGAEA
ncbi:MAG: hypothetical protein WA005_02795 [Candidatus Binataceae bacterium]